MSVNLNQLPIPDWGLRCPRCGYRLQGLPSHRCPECGTRLNMPEIVQPWTRLRDPRFTGRELPLPDFGLTCDACQRSLVGAERHACPHCDEPFDPFAHHPPQRWVPVDPQIHYPLPLQTIELVLRTEQVPYVVHDTHTALGVPGWRLLVPSEFYFEFLWLTQQALQQLGPQPAQNRDESWECRHCNESNPGGFDLCWNCQAAR